MKYMGMPFGMWVLFAGSFQKQPTAVLGYDAGCGTGVIVGDSKSETSFPISENAETA